MTAEEELELDARLVEQVVQSPAWEVITRRLGYAIERHTAMIIDVSQLDLGQTQALRQRIASYRELLDLPRYIREEIKKMHSSAPATVGEGEPGTET